MLRYKWKPQEKEEGMGLVDEVMDDACALDPLPKQAAAGPR